MIKVLIADDEPLVCVGLQSMIRWEDYGIEIAGTARNGQQALEMIELRRPEIVISDIKMPLKSGLELAEECSKKYGRVPLFIILTSFEEFDFIRRALSVQAVDYLIKIELSPESLGAAVTKALSMLREIRRAEGGPEQEAGQGAARLRDEFFRALYHHRVESLEFFRQSRDSLGLELLGPALTVIAGEVLGPDGKAAGSFLSAVWMLREMLEKLYPCYVTPLEDGRFTILFCLEDEDPALFRKRFEAGLLKTIGILRDYFSVHVRMAAGKPVGDPLRLDESYRSACGELEEAGGENPLRFFEKSLQRQNYQRNLVAKVEKYIGENLDKRLNLPDVAAEFNLSPNYLSRLFTRYAGEGFVEYITAAKIAAAKTMLLKGEGPVYEIAEKLGYESAFYFSKVFKKLEGISPREFLHRHEIAPLDARQENPANH
ncbi:MAG: helix-turn-helix domain-containing protein [Spirochaetaceae bacterium]|jgi:two-component system response regulator YesN|nr:helix-turn-helix domain-containing protein [Spirochaetaceae bacterium]